MYGYSKHMFDLWALKHHCLEAIAGLKYFNVYGPYEDYKGEMRSLVQKAYHQVKSHGHLELFNFIFIVALLFELLTVSLLFDIAGLWTGQNILQQQGTPRESGTVAPL